MFVLETNVLSELRAGKRTSFAAVRGWAAGTPVTQLYLAAVSVLELEIGVLSMERRGAGQGAILRVWLGGVMQAFSGRVPAFSGRTAVPGAAMHVPDGRAERDSMIAATAKEHGYTVVTRNVDDFVGCGVEVINPWGEAS